MLLPQTAPDSAWVDVCAGKRKSKDKDKKDRKKKKSSKDKKDKKVSSLSDSEGMLSCVLQACKRNNIAK